jgi:hypothetical protein
VTASIEDTRQFLMTCWIDEVNCNQGIKRLQAYRRQRDKKGRWKETALHDDASDGADAMRCLAAGLLSQRHTGKAAGFLAARKRPGNAAFW